MPVTDRRMSLLAVVIFIITCLLAGCKSPNQGDFTAKELAEHIVAAHGGWENWNNAQSISYVHTLTFGNPPNIWVSSEVAEQRSPHRLYQEYKSGGFLAWNGSEVWTSKWSLDNPPAVMPFLTHLSLIVPWLTKDPGAVLTGPDRERIPGDSIQTYLTLTLTLPTDTTKPPHAKYYKIYADSTTFRIKGVAYSVAYGELLDLMGMQAEVEEFGPMTHIFEEFHTIDGLVIPTKYFTIGPGGGIAGTHTVENWSFTTPFDASKLDQTADAVVAKFQYKRKAVGTSTPPY